MAPAGRPRGEVRLALGLAAHDLAASDGAAHWRAIAARAQVGFAVAKATVNNMLAAGELRVVGQMRTPHAKRPMTLFAPGTRAVDAASAPQRLADVMRCWPQR